MAAATLNIDECKTKLQGLKTRADALAAKQTSLERDVTVQEEAQKRAIQELKDLGYPEVEKMTPVEIADFGVKLTAELARSMEDLEKSIVTTEALLGISKTASDLD